MFKDHFSGHAAGYARYRPDYPEALFAYIADCCERHTLAWDCATGNGQAALGLAPHFERVVATDASAEQIAEAMPHEQVAYRVAPAEASPLANHSADLVTVAQALHWFQFEAFYTEVRRVLRPGGVLAVWGYNVPRITPAVDAEVARYYDGIVASYWPPERHYFDDDYRSIPFPFDEEPTPEIEMTLTWRLNDLLGYLGTWSATQRYRQAHGTDPVEHIRADLSAAWGDAEAEKSIHWPLFVRVGR